MKFDYKSRFVEARRAFADAASGKGSSVTCGTRIQDKGKMTFQPGDLGGHRAYIDKEGAAHNHLMICYIPESSFKDGDITIKARRTYETHEPGMYTSDDITKMAGNVVKNTFSGKTPVELSLLAVNLRKEFLNSATKFNGAEPMDVILDLVSDLQESEYERGECEAEACSGRVPSRSRKATAYADYGDAARIAEGLLSKARKSRRYNPTFSYEQISEWFGVSLDDVMNIADSINRELNVMKGVACSSLSRSGVSLTLHHGVTPTAAQRAATSSMVRGGAPIEFRAELGMFMLKVDEKDQVVEKGHATADVYVNANSIEEAEQKSYRAVEKYGKGKGWDEVHVFRTIIFPSSHPPVGKRDMPEDEHWEITAGTKRKASAMFLGIDDALTREQQAKVSDAFQAAVHEAVSYANDHLPDNYSATRLCFGNNLFYAIGSERDDVAGPYDPDKYGPFLFDVSVDVSMKDVSDKDPTLTFRIDEVKGKGGERTGRNLLRKDLRLSEFLGMSKPAFLLRATDTDVIGEAVARAFRGTKATASTAKKCVK